MPDSGTLLAIGAAVLAGVAVALAWPVPVALSRARWPVRHPAIALLVWQAIGLAGGFSMIGALLLAGLLALPGHPAIAAIPAVALAAYLLAHLAITIVQVLRQRRRHIALLALLSAPHPTRARTRVIDDEAPVAYCLPRGIGSVTVLSRGLLERLGDDELGAVIAHERAHVEQRHDILLVAFRAWRAALPRFPVAAIAEDEVAALVEMLADDRARRHASGDALARAILTVSGGALAPRATRPGSRDAAPLTARHRDRVLRLSGRSHASRADRTG